MNSPHLPHLSFPPELQRHRRALRARLLALACGAEAASDANRTLLAEMLAGRLLGQGCLPPDLGLGPAVAQAMLDGYFSGLVASPLAAPDPRVALPEWEDLRQLLLEHRAGERGSEMWMADIVATACVGAEHLWRDLGLSCRDDLNLLMLVNFPALAAANSGDMKWKKFLYRQFCASEGIYVCPAPSCGVCADYARCFAPEV